MVKVKTPKDIKKWIDADTFIMNGKKYRMDFKGNVVEVKP